MYKTVDPSEGESDFYKGFTEKEKTRIFSVLTGKKVKICEIMGNAIIGEEMLDHPKKRFDVSIHCLSVMGKYFRLKAGALPNLPNALKRDLSKMVHIKRSTRIAQFRKLVGLLLNNYRKMPKQVVAQYVRFLFSRVGEFFILNNELGLLEIFIFIYFFKI